MPMRRSVCGPLAAVALVACSPRDKPAPADEDASEPAKVVKPAVAPVRKLVEKQLAEKTDGTPYRVVTGKLTGFGNKDRGNGIGLSDGGQGSRTILAHSLTKIGEGTEFTLFGLDGKELVTVSNVYQTVAAFERAAVGLGPNDHGNDRMAVLDLKTGKVTEPVIELAGTKVVQTRIAIDQIAGTVWVFAKGDNGKTYYGVWKAVAEPRLVLTATIPFWPQMISTERGILVWLPSRPYACGVLALREGTDPACAPNTLPRTHGTRPHLLGDRYWIGDDFPPVAVDATTPHAAPTQLAPDCEGTSVVLATLPKADRVLVGCGNDKDEVTLTVWSPSGTWTGTQVYKLISGWSTEGPPLADPVMGVERFLGTFDAVPLSHWIDIANATVYTSRPFSPLHYGGFEGYPRRFIVRPPDAPKELWVVDLAGGFTERIATDVTCPHTLVASYEGVDRATVLCVEPILTGSAIKPGSWSEIVDFNARTRTHVDGVAIDHVVPDGRGIGTTLTRPMRVAVVAP